MNRLTPIQKLQAIRLVILDVDGVLTTGQLRYSGEGDTSVQIDFHVRDGLGIKLLQRAGIDVGIITARTSPAVTQRMAYLGVQHVFQGQHDKIAAYIQLRDTLQLTDMQIAYMGDDLPDLPLLHRVGFSATVADATPLLHKAVDWISETNGGRGAVREFAEHILQAQGKLDALIARYYEV